MTPQELFDMLMAYPQPTRTEILNHIDEVTRNYEPERVEALLADFAEMLFQWQCGETYGRAKWEHEAREAEHRAKYEADNATYFECVRLEEMRYLGYGVPKIEWPEEPEPYEPLLFIPPMPGTIADNIHIPAMYSYAVELLNRKTAPEVDALTGTLNLPSELDTPEAKTIFDELVKQNYCKRDGAVYQWTGTNALLGYMVLKVSDKLDILHDNDRLPWKIFQRAFALTDQQIRTASNVASKVKNKKQNEPLGYAVINRLCK